MRLLERLALILAVFSVFCAVPAWAEEGEEEERIPIPEIVARIVAEDLPGVRAIVETDPNWAVIRHPMGWTPLHATQLNKKTEMLLFLLAQKKVDVNAPAKEQANLTILHQMAALDKKAFVEILVANGADVNVRNARGETPLHWAAMQGGLETAEYLVGKGAQLEAKDEKGKTPLQSTRHTAMVALLKKLGARP